MRFLLCCLLFICSRSVMAQDTLYFDQNLRTASKEKFDLYRVVIQSKDTFYVKEYDKENVLRMEGSFLSLKPEIRSGKFYIYNKFGGLNVECFYQNNILDGYQTSYDLYNNIIAKYLYENGIITDTLIKERDINKVDHQDKSPKLLNTADEMPEFTGGEVALRKYLKKHLTYPKEAKRKKVEGTVSLRFIVTNEGRVEDVRVVEGIGSGCDEVAIQAFKIMPRWTPGKQNGLWVNVWLTQQVQFPYK